MDGKLRYVGVTITKYIVIGNRENSEEMMRMLVGLTEIKSPNKSTLNLIFHR